MSQGLDVQVAVLEARQDAYDADIREIKESLKVLRDKIGMYRPPWSVVALITVLTSACVGLLVKMVGG